MTAIASLATSEVGVQEVTMLHARGKGGVEVSSLQRRWTSSSPVRLRSPLDSVSSGCLVPEVP